MSCVEFWFEFACTYSYPAALRIGRLAQQLNVGITWRPFLLGPIFKSQRWQDSPFNLYPVRGRYMWRDLERICAALQLPFQRPSQFPRNGLTAARIACQYEHAPWLPEFVRRVYVANFAEDRDIADEAVLGAILASLGQPATILVQAQGAEAKNKLRAQTERAVELGIFGAPSVTCGNELFWGNDRLEQALTWATQQMGKHPPAT
jgi:2-hydroxychromene-2-carboxylate isomerase